MVLTYSSSFCKGCTVASCLLCKYQPTKVHDFGSYGKICTGESCDVCKSQGTVQGEGIIGATEPEPLKIKSTFDQINSIANSYNYVIIRTRYAGIHCGILEIYDPATQQVILKQARRIWYWEGAFTPTALALEGFKTAKLSLTFPRGMLITGVVEIMPVEENIQKFLSEYPAHNPEDKMEED